MATVPVSQIEEGVASVPVSSNEGGMASAGKSWGRKCDLCASDI